MKKLLTLCTMLALVASAAFAGTSYKKDKIDGLKSNATSVEQPSAEKQALIDQLAIESIYTKLANNVDLTPAEKEMILDYEAQNPSREGNLDAVGGPDLYGYMYVDNMDGDTSTFDWIEISNTGTLIAGASNADDAAGPATWGWSFPFYGASYSLGYAGSNGTFQFTTNSSSYSNTCTLPSSVGPAIFPFWDDQHTGRGGTGTSGTVSDSGAVFFQDFGSYVVIQWDSVGRYSPSFQHTYTYELILYPDGKAKVQILALDVWPTSTTNPSPTVAIQGTGAGNALPYFCSTAATPDGNLTGRAIWFYPPASAPTGRCCYLDGGHGACRDDMTGEDCDAIGGAWGGPGTTCADNPCPVGRCCYYDGVAGACADVIQLECNFLGGTWASGLNCTDSPCTVGRCCYDDAGHAGCADVIEAECDFLAGTWASGLTCTANPCPVALQGSDDCPGPLLTAPITVAGTTVGATVEVGLPFCGTSYTAPGVWYTVVGTGNTLTASLCGSSYDTKLHVYCGDCGAFTCIGGNDDFCSLQSQLSWCSNAGTTYHILVSGFSASVGDYTLALSDDGVACTGAINCNPEGRCCYIDGASGATACADLLAEDCAALGGEFDAEATCADGPCGGSCCYIEAGQGFCDNIAHCDEDVLESACLVLGGTWYAGLSCAETPCNANPCVCECTTYANAHGTLAADETTYPIDSAIPTTCVTINVPIEYHITDLNVNIDLVHTFDADLDMFLTSPLGTIVELSTDNGGSGENFTCTEFDDEAVDPITGGVAPFTGSFQPEGMLSDFDGENAVGDWLLCITDDAGGDVGYIIGVCLKFEYDEILPVAFGSFDAVAGNGKITLNWNTMSEHNVDHFELSRDGSVVTTIAAHNEASEANYSFVDNDVTNGVEYSYSLVSVDVNGNRQNLATVSATPNAGAVVSEYALHQNYPNPFNPTTNIVFDMLEAGHVTISVYNIMGQKVAELVNGVAEAGRHSVTFDATSLSSGLYLYKMEANGFTAQSKMVLMK